MHQNVPERDDLIASFTPSIHFDVHVTVHRVKFLIIKPTRCTNFSDLFLEWNSTCKVRVPQGGILTLRLKHHFTITSSTSTMWFSRSLLYVANHTVFKVNHMVEDQSPGSRPTTGSSRPILLPQVLCRFAYSFIRTLYRTYECMDFISNVPKHSV